MSSSGLSFAKKGIEDLAFSYQADVDPISGAATVAVPLSLTPGRSGFGPSLSLQYGSGGSNSVFGVGWAMAGLPAIGLNTKDGLPDYTGSDKYFFSGTGELVPTIQKQEDNSWQPQVIEHSDYWIHYFRSQVDQSFTRFEKWVHKSTRQVHWRVRDSSGVVSILGADPQGNSRIYNPDDDPAASCRTYLWLLEAQYDRNGNAIFYDYVPEDSRKLDIRLPFERDRILNTSKFAQRYLKRIRYGNTKPLKPNQPIPADNSWLFEAVLDYGDHTDQGLPEYTAIQSWPVRDDPFSNYQAGFEVRTYRLCQRVLMFHHFKELGASPTLVGATTMTYKESPAGTTLESIGYKGFRKNTGAGQVFQRSLQPLKFTYSDPQIGKEFLSIPEQSTENFPYGLSDANYQWIDLYGEGLPGILTETDEAWYYKPNLGGGSFGTQQQVRSKPSQLVGTYALSDFDQDGNLDLVVLDSTQAGFYEFDRESQRWGGFRPFAAAPQIDTLEAEVQWLDINGDGYSDLVISRQNRLTWFPSKGKEGFENPVDLTQASLSGSNQPPLIGEDPSLDFFFADMNGDGLLDLVRIQNGRVEYWPQLGHGRFGTSVLMNGAPCFDLEMEFDSSRLRLVDLDGSGTADLLYIGRGEVRYWINASGNQLIEGKHLKGLPYIDNLSSVQVLDFLGDGTACLVWSSALMSHRDSPMHYLPLTSEVQPRLLMKLDNSMGQAVKFDYASSSTHYLRDLQAGQPWISKLPSHTMVVNRKTVIDQIAKNQFVSRYEYHDGYFDSGEREFRGFSFVEQYDSEAFDRTEFMVDESYTAPVCVRTWFHNGAFGWDTRRFGQFYKDDAQQAFLSTDRFEALGSYLTAQDYEGGVRSLAGQMIRQEVYATDQQGKRAKHPYQITHSNYRLRQLQPAKNNHDASLFFYPSEQLSHHYEETAADPRVTHQMTLAVDRFGNVEQACEIAYPRRDGAKSIIPEQQRHYITAAKQTYLNLVANDRYELGISLETQSFEIAGLPRKANELFQLDTVKAELETALASPRPFHENFDTVGVQARLLVWNQNYFWNDTRTAELPLGQVGQPVLPHHSESACFTEPLIADIYGNRVDRALLEQEGKYLFRDAYGWIAESVTYFQGADGFYLPSRVEHRNSAVNSYAYDAYFLTMVGTEDGLGNRTRADINYYQLAPYRIIDANENTAEVLYDPLGVVVVSSSYGTVQGTNGVTLPYGNEPLSTYNVSPNPDFETVWRNPDQYVQAASSFLYYELDSWEKSQSPLRSLALMREDYVHDGQRNTNRSSRIQITAAYVDGFGRSLQTKRQVEAGPALQRNAAGKVVLNQQDRPEEVYTETRWLVSGHTVYNNKQQPIRQYEPYYSAIVAFESDEVLRTYGETTRTHYDALGRGRRVDLPNGTFSKVEVSPWEVRNYDPNDTVKDSTYRTERETVLKGTAEEQALRKAMAHADTPSTVQLDPLGRQVVQIAVGEAGERGLRRVNRSQLDIQGNVVAIIDPRGLTAFRYRYDMLGRRLYEQGVDNGKTWSLPDALGQVLHNWDGQGIHQRYRYDRLGRPTEVFVQGAGLNQVVQQMTYGESEFVVDAAKRNLRGQLVKQLDQAGVVSVGEYTPDGNPLSSKRQLVQDYTVEPSWNIPGTVQLEQEEYVTQSTYDALGRVKQQQLPDGTTRVMSYLRGGGVSQVQISTADGQLQNVPFLQSAEMNARRQLTRRVLGNGVEIDYDYDPETFRMRWLKSRKPAATSQENNTRWYQCLRYTYDPVGNLIHVIDYAQQPTLPAQAFQEPPLATDRPQETISPLMQGLTVSAHSEFTYDAFYQLTQAKGRVHQALQRQHSQVGRSFPASKNTQHLRLNNGAAVERYTRSYAYDISGNIERIDHRAKGNAWVKTMWIDSESNHSVPGETLAGLPVRNPEARFDANGNCLGLPDTKGTMVWNYRNNLAQVVVIDRSEDGQPNDAEYYVYGADGMRVRKVHERMLSAGENGQPAKVEITEKIYLDGCEIKRIRQREGQAVGAPSLERYTSHISDGENTIIARLHQWTVDKTGRETVQRLEKIGLSDVTPKRIHYQLANHLGSSSLELDEKGDLISYEEYFPFGGTAFVSGEKEKDIELKEYRYSGKERDSATGFYYYGYRYYAPWIGRWLSADPIGPEDAVNLYVFTLNNPVNLVDPNGLKSNSNSTRNLSGRVIHSHRRYSSNEIRKYLTNKELRDFKANNLQIIEGRNKKTGNFEYFIAKGKRNEVKRYLLSRYKKIKITHATITREQPQDRVIYRKKTILDFTKSEKDTQEKTKRDTDGRNDDVKNGQTDTVKDDRNDGIDGGKQGDVKDGNQDGIDGGKQGGVVGGSKDGVKEGKLGGKREGKTTGQIDGHKDGNTPEKTGNPPPPVKPLIDFGNNSDINRSSAPPIAGGDRLRTSGRASKDPYAISAIPVKTIFNKIGKWISSLGLGRIADWFDAQKKKTYDYLKSAFRQSGLLGKIGIGASIALFGVAIEITSMLLDSFRFGKGLEDNGIWGLPQDLFRATDLFGIGVGIKHSARILKTGIERLGSGLNRIGGNRSFKLFSSNSKTKSIHHLPDHWNRYYYKVGEQGDDLNKLIDTAKDMGVTVKTNARESAYDKITKTIELSSNAKRWEFFEEFLHYVVDSKGWKKSEIEVLKKVLRSTKDQYGRRARILKPARAAEEIVVKEWLIEHGLSLGLKKADIALLYEQVEILRKYGVNVKNPY